MHFLNKNKSFHVHIIDQPITFLPISLCHNYVVTIHVYTCCSFCVGMKQSLLNKMEIHSWTCFSPHLKKSRNESLDMFRHVSVHILNKMEIHPWTCLEMFIQMRTFKCPHLHPWTCLDMFI